MKGMGSSITLIMGFSIFILLVIVVGILGSGVSFSVNLNTELSQDRDIFKSRSASAALLSNKSLLKNIRDCTTDCSISKSSKIKNSVSKNLNMYSDYKFNLRNENSGDQIISEKGGNGNGYGTSVYIASPSNDLHTVNIEVGRSYR